MDDGLLSLKWNNHQSTFQFILSKLRDKPLYSDVTIACNGQLYPAHKLVLSSCSSYFSQILNTAQCSHPVIVLKDIDKQDVEALLDYMYVGEVNIKQSSLSNLIKAAECLQIKGLAGPDELPDCNNTENICSKETIARRTSDLDKTIADSVAPITSDEIKCNNRKVKENKGRYNEANDNSLKKRKLDSTVRNDLNVHDRKMLSIDNIKTELTDDENNSGNNNYDVDVRSARNLLVHKLEAVSPVEKSFPSSSNKTSLTDEENEEFSEVAALPCDLFADNNKATQILSSLFSRRLSATDQHLSTANFISDDKCAKGGACGSFNRRNTLSPFYLNNDGDELSNDGNGYLSSRETNSGLFDGIVETKCSLLDSGRETNSTIFDNSGDNNINIFNSHRDPNSTIFNNSRIHNRSLYMNSESEFNNRSDLISPSSDLISPTGDDYSNSPNKTNSLEEPLYCPYCGKLCKRRDHLKLHVRIHTGEKPFQCPYCSRKTNQKNNLKLHIRNVHPGLSVDV